jgi:uncharacterized membrane protein YhaH (DUF805 family)
MFNYYVEAITKKYADFDGRARRSEYWYFFLCNLIAQYGLGYILGLLSITIAGGFTVIYSLALLVPSIAVAIRRMHDVGKSGWYILIPIYNIILLCTDSNPGSNEYGPNPKGIGNNATDDQLINSIGQ